MNTLTYLNRIEYGEKPGITIQTLNQLQRHHLLTVPFENLDIHFGKRIEFDKTYEKVVIGRRGGFCYELNSLFFELLKDIGFAVKLISARVYNQKNDFGPEFDHMAIIAELEGTNYLVDVGFGEFALLPLKIELNTKQADPRGNFMIQQYDDTYLLVSKEEEQHLVPQYIFSLVSRDPVDFNDMLNYHQTSPDSHFTQKRLCSLPTETGRITITGDLLRIKENDRVSERSFTNDGEFRQALRHYFKIEV